MGEPHMNYCMECGTKLQEKWLESEGKRIPWCPKCGDYRFPVFSTAVSMIVTSKEKDRILLIRQYGRDSFILVAGYVSQGEDAEDACRRELREEMGLEAEEVRFNHSHYFAPSNTLMLNFTVTAHGDPHPNREVDSYGIFTPEEARKKIRRPSLAQAFLDGYLDGVYHF